MFTLASAVVIFLLVILVVTAAYGRHLAHEEARYHTRSNAKCLRELQRIIDHEPSKLVESHD